MIALTERRSRDKKETYILVALGSIEVAGDKDGVLYCLMYMTAA